MHFHLSMTNAANPKHGLIYGEVTDSEIKESKKQILTEPAIACIAVGLVYVNPIL